MWTEEREEAGMMEKTAFCLAQLSVKRGDGQAICGPRNQRKSADEEQGQWL